MTPNGGPPDPDLVIDVTELRHEQQRMRTQVRQQRITLALSALGWVFLFGILAGDAGMSWWGFGATVLLALTNGYVVWRWGFAAGQLELGGAILKRLETLIDEREKNG